MGIGILLEFKNKWIHMEKGKKRKPPTFSVFMYFGVWDRLRNPLLKYVLSQFLGWRAAHGYCRASFSRLLCQTIFHRTCRWPPSSFKKFRTVSVPWNNPWPHKEMDTIPYRHSCLLTTHWGHQKPEPHTKWTGTGKNDPWNNQGQEPQRNKCLCRLQKSANTFQWTNQQLKQKQLGRTVIFIFDFGFLSQFIKVNSTFYALNNEKWMKILGLGSKNKCKLFKNFILLTLHSISVCLWNLCLQNFTGFEVCLYISLQMLILYIAGT